MSKRPAKTHPLANIMNPRSVVVVGASNNLMKMGSIQAINLISSGYQGEILFLHPSEKNVLGRPAYPAPADLPIVPDLALLVTPTKITPRLLDELGQKGVRYAVIVTAGFREVGPDGAQMEKEMVEVAKRHGLRFVGPNCIGILNANISLNLTVCPYLDRPGKFSLISQSGTYVAQTMPYLREKGIRYSHAISVGNATDIDIVDCLEFLAEDENTSAIGIYMEGLKRGREFIDTARKMVKTKPIIALYVGGTEAGARSGLSHTSSMGGPDVLFDGIFEQAGVIRASTIEELFDWGSTLANMPVPAGNRIGILTHSGGPATSMADACERVGLELPEFSAKLQQEIQQYIEPTASAKNPVDLTFSMEHDKFVVKIPELLFASDEIDAVLVHGMMDTGFAEQMFENMKNIVDIPKEDFFKTLEFDLTRIMQLPGESGKPMAASNFLREDHAAKTFHDNDIPLFFTPEKAVKAMNALVQYGLIRKRMDQEADAIGQVEAETVETLPSGLMDEHEAKLLLAQSGIPTAPERLCASLAEALAQADEIGYPVVLKGLAEGVAHKSESGLVHLDLRSAEELKIAWEKIDVAFPACPRLLAKMLRGERELVVGMVRFEAFGPCVMLGIGGIFTETYRDIVFRAWPISHAEAKSMPKSLHLHKLFEAQRGLPPVDLDDLAQIVTAVGNLAAQHPEIKEIDINPLIVVDGKPIAVDALIFVAAPNKAGAKK